MNLPSNLWKSPVIKRRLMTEACFECSHGISLKPFYWVIVPEADSKDGFHILQNYKASMIDVDPHDLQQDFAKGVQRELQQEACFDGLWLVGFTHPPSSYGVMTDTENCWNRTIMIWHDEDGDPQYTLESDLPFIEQVQHGINYYVGLAHKAHDQWKQVYSPAVLKEDMQLNDSDTSKVALEALKYV